MSEIIFIILTIVFLDHTHQTKIHPDELTLYEDGLYYKTSYVSKKRKESINQSKPNNQKRERFNTYYKNGQLKTRLSHINNKLDGLCWSYYENGQLDSKETYKNGKREGLIRLYYDNGQLRSSGRFKKGKEEGLHKTYFESGQLKSKGRFKKGVHDGLHEIYYENGQLRGKSSYEDGINQKIHKEYYSDGRLKFERKYYNKDVLYSKEYHYYGNEVTFDKEIVFYDKSNKFQEYYKNDTLLVRLIDKEDGYKVHEYFDLEGVFVKKVCRRFKDQVKMIYCEGQ